MSVLHSSVPAIGALARVHQGTGDGGRLSLVATNLSGKVGTELEVLLVTVAEYRVDAFPSNMQRGEFRRTPAIRFTGRAAIAPEIRASYRGKTYTIANAGIAYSVDDVLTLSIGTLRHQVVVREVTEHGQVIAFTVLEGVGSAPIRALPREANHYPIGGTGRNLVLTILFEIAEVELLSRGQGVEAATFDVVDGDRRFSLEAATQITIGPEHRLVILKLDPDAMMSLNDVPAGRGDVILVRSKGTVAVRVIGE